MLEERIAAGQENYQKIIIRLKDRMDKESLNSSLSLSSYTRQAAHALAVRALKEHAEITQKNLLEFLDSEQSLKNVRLFKSYWIDNLIWAETKTELVEKIARFPEVEIIFPDIAVTTIAPDIDPSPLSLGTQEAGDNLRVIGADSMWKMGYTGEGTLACTFDTGIEGDHPALEGSYRGKFGYSHEQCWFDPINNDTFPHIFSTTQISPEYRPHGTGTISLIVGKDDSSGDTVGVAFGAQWISAGVVDVRDALGRTNIYLLDAFQWAADPDDDPNTIEDVPDVISNSWGYPTNYLGCSDVFYGVIDNVEALGTIVMFSAGNSGSTYRTLVNPANRATDPYNSFAVGMISKNYETPTVDAMSSRGPSNCNPTIIKPNVVAPGRQVPIAYPVEMSSGAPYGTGTGTSFSCPHAAGAALLLRQYNPNAPVDSVKKALMVGAIDINELGPDSAAGYGLIYIPDALEYLGPNDEPNIFLSSTSYPFIEPGDTVEIGVTLKNSGPGV
jgi:subtilisin family serine protease